MEQALLDGEHQTEMTELQREQEIINQLKLKHEEIVEKAAVEREKVLDYFFILFLFSYLPHPTQSSSCKLSFCNRTFLGGGFFLNLSQYHLVPFSFFVYFLLYATFLLILISNLSSLIIYHTSHQRTNMAQGHF